MDTSTGLKESDLRAENEALKLELERLHRELAQTSHEKIQSAQYGLVLLDEKQALQQRCDELEAMYDTTKHELEILKEALAKVQTSQKVSTTTGIEQEESLLQETATKEASLTSSLQELEKELKQVRQELGRVLAEKERLQTENYEIMKHGDVSDWERKNLRSELKDMKLREQRLLTDNNELEEENISLQKQVSSLRSSQVEFEGAKHEVRRLKEEVESLNAQLEELGSLRRIGEQQLEEALEALQSEREQKYALRRELDQRLTAESPVFHLDGLSFAGFRLGSKRSLPPLLMHRLSVREPPTTLHAGSGFNSGNDSHYTRSSRGGASLCGSVSKLSLSSPWSSKLKKRSVKSRAEVSGRAAGCGGAVLSSPGSSLACTILPCGCRGVRLGSAATYACGGHVCSTVGVSPCTSCDADSSLDSGVDRDLSPQHFHRATHTACHSKAHCTSGEDCGRVVPCSVSRGTVHLARGSPVCIEHDTHVPICGQLHDSCCCVRDQSAVTSCSCKGITFSNNAQTCHCLQETAHSSRAASKLLSRNPNGHRRRRDTDGVCAACRNHSGENTAADLSWKTEKTADDQSIPLSTHKSQTQLHKDNSLSPAACKRADPAFSSESFSFGNVRHCCPGPGNNNKNGTLDSHTLECTYDPSSEKGGTDLRVSSNTIEASHSEQPVQLTYADKNGMCSDEGFVVGSSKSLQKQLFEGSRCSSVSSISPILYHESFPELDWPGSASTEGSVIGAYLPRSRAVSSCSATTTSESTKQHSWHCKGRKAVCRISCAMVDYVFAP